MNNSYNIMITHFRSIYNEDNSKILYFKEENYLWNIKEVLERDGIYYLSKNEYIKVMVSDDDGVKACYGGSIKNESY